MGSTSQSIPAQGQSPREHAFHAFKRPGHPQADRPVLRPQRLLCSASLEARGSAINCDLSKLRGRQRHFEELGLQLKEN